jgi:hypothetical protein
MIINAQSIFSAICSIVTGAYDISRAPRRGMAQKVEKSPRTRVLISDMPDIGTTMGFAM